MTLATTEKTSIKKDSLTVSERCRMDQYSAEASELGIAPGVVPETVHVVPPIGNGRPFRLVSIHAHKFEYLQQWGCIGLTIWND